MLGAGLGALMLIACGSRVGSLEGSTDAGTEGSSDPSEEADGSGGSEDSSGDGAGGGGGPCANDAKSEHLIIEGPTQSNPQGQHVNPRPAVAMADNGRYVVAWTGTALVSDAVFTKVYAANGSAQTEHTRVSPQEHYVHRAPAVAMDATGDFVVAYLDDAQYAAHVRFYDEEGLPRTDTIRVSDEGHFVQSTPAVAMAADGSAVVAWTTDVDEIFAAFVLRLDPDGDPMGEIRRVSPQEHFVTAHPAVGMSADGGFVVAWNTEGSDPFAIFARQFGSDGGALGSAFQVSPTEHFTARPPSIGMAPDGRFVVIWWHPEGDIYARPYDSGAQAVADPVRANEGGYVEEGWEDPHVVTARASVAMNADGNFLVSWTDAAGDYRVHARLFDAQGVPLGDQFPVTGPLVTDLPPAVGASRCFDDYVVAYNDQVQGSDVNHVHYRADDDDDGQPDMCCH